MKNRIQLALEVHRADPSTRGCISLTATQCPAPTPRRPQREAELLLCQLCGWQPWSQPHTQRTPLSFPTTPQRSNTVGCPALFGTGTCRRLSAPALLSSTVDGSAPVLPESRQRLLVSSELQPFPQRPLLVLCSRSRDLANGSGSTFHLRSAHQGEVAQKIQNRLCKGHSGLAFQRDFLSRVCKP